MKSGTLSSKTKKPKTSKTKKKSNSKKSTKGNRNEVNFKNPKVRRTLSLLELSEGRLSKEAFFQSATKDIFYQMKNSGLIKVERKMVLATGKLRCLTAKNGSHISSSNSFEHSKKAAFVISSLIPSSVLERHSFVSQSDLEVRYRRDFAKNPVYKTRLDSLRENCKANLTALRAKGKNPSCISDEQRYLDRLSYTKEYERLSSLESLLETSPVLVPDAEFTLRREELDEFLENLRSYQKTLDNERERSFAEEALNRLSSLPGDAEEVTFSLEITTVFYRNREMIRHENYATITGQNLIFL